MIRPVAMSGVINKVVAVLPDANTTDGSYAIWEREGERNRYVVGAVNGQTTGDGSLWYSGSYVDNFDEAFAILLRRAGYKDLAAMQELKIEVEG